MYDDRYYFGYKDAIVRGAISTTYSGICQYCGKGYGNSIDHIVPASHGGHNLLGNYTLACASCNTKKRNAMLEESLKSNLVRRANELAPIILEHIRPKWLLQERQINGLRIVYQPRSIAFITHALSIHSALLDHPRLKTATAVDPIIKADPIIKNEVYSDKIVALTLKPRKQLSGFRMVTLGKRKIRLNQFVRALWWLQDIRFAISSLTPPDSEDYWPWVIATRQYQKILNYHQDCCIRIRLPHPSQELRDTIMSLRVSET